MKSKHESDLESLNLKLKEGALSEEEHAQGVKSTQANFEQQNLQLNTDYEKLKKTLNDEFELRKGSYDLLNAEISNSFEEDCKEILEASSQIKRICMNFVDPSGKARSRSMKPCLNFGELQAYVETLFADYLVVLTTPLGSVIGSQDELLFAYQDLEEGVTVLTLDLALSRKRKREDEPSGTSLGDDNSDGSEAVSINYKNTNSWSAAEMELFKTGVRLYGWGKWKAISRIVRTRDMDQTRTFSRGKWPQQFKATNVSHNVIAELTSAIKNATEIVKHEHNEFE